MYGAHLAVLYHDSDDAGAEPLLLLIRVRQDQVPTQPHALLQLCRMMKGVPLMYTA